MEELGRGLVPEPMRRQRPPRRDAPCCSAASDAQKQTLLPAVAAGERLLALAYQEAGSRYDVSRVATRAERAGSGWKLDGEKIQVLDGHAADRLIVSARTGGEPRDDDGVTLFLVRADTPGVDRRRGSGASIRATAALVRLDGVTLPADAVLGVEGAGRRAARARARPGDRSRSAAEMLGGMTAAFEMTLDYLKTRKQFGVPIGSFQALKHRAARLFVETELARSVVMAAAQARSTRACPTTQVARHAVGRQGAAAPTPSAGRQRGRADARRHRHDRRARHRALSEARAWCRAARSATRRTIATASPGSTATERRAPRLRRGRAAERLTDARAPAWCAWNAFRAPIDSAVWC